MNGAELKKAKRRIRREVLEARDAIPAERRERLGALVAERFLALPELQGAGVVMAFWSFGSELPTRPLLEALVAEGITVALPRIDAGDLQARTWRPGEPMTGTRFGALEPAAGAVLEPVDVDVVAVPAVAFDRVGGRVGYGGGFYDRFLPRTRPDAARVGVGFGVQLVSEALPSAPFDERVDVVLTETEIVRCPRPR